MPTIVVATEAPSSQVVFCKNPTAFLDIVVSTLYKLLHVLFKQQDIQDVEQAPKNSWHVDPYTEV
jgi:hypothetical protein